MDDIPVTKFWDEGMEGTIGNLRLTPEGRKIIEASPEIYQFGISFTGDVNEDGTYSNCKLMSVSLIHTQDYIYKRNKRGEYSNMTYEKIKEVDAIQYHAQEWADNPYTFDSTPLWLEQLIKNNQLVARFEGEDYWYLYLDTGDIQRGTSNRYKIGPDSWIIRDEDGTILGMKPDEFKIWYKEKEN